MYNTILVPVENRESDQTILRHIRSLARLTHANLVLVHVADGWAARNFERFQLQESEEMKQDREYLATLSAQLEADGYQVKTVLAMGDPATEIIKLAQARLRNLREGAVPHERISTVHLWRRGRPRRLSLARAGEIDAGRSSLLRRPEMGGREFIRLRIRIGRGRIHLSQAVALRLRSRAALHRFQYREHRCRPRALPYVVQPLRRDSRQD